MSSLRGFRWFPEISVAQLNVQGKKVHCNNAKSRQRVFELLLQVNIQFPFVLVLIVLIFFKCTKVK